MLKKVMAIILSGLLTFGLVGVTSVSAAPLDITFDFETDADVDMTIPEGETTTVSGWKAGERGGTIKRNTEDIEPLLTELGSSCLELVAEEGGVGRGVMYRITGLKPKGTYEVSGYVKGDDYVAFGLSGNITDGFATWPIGISKKLTGKWEKLSTIVTLNQADSWSGVSHLALRNDTNAKILFDHIRIREVTAPTEAVPSSAINGSFENLTTRDTSSSNTTQVLAPSGWTIGDNLKNGEDAATYAVISDDYARSGNYSLKLCDNNSVYANRVLHDIKGLTVGKTYMVTSYVLIDQDYETRGGTQTGAGMLVIQEGGTTTSASNSYNYSSREGKWENTNGKWVPIRDYFVAPTANVRLALYAHAYAKGTWNSMAVTAYFDDISIKEVSGIDLIATDSTTGKEFTKLDTTKENKVDVLINGTNSDTTAEKNYKLIYAIYNKNGEVTEVSAISLRDELVPKGDTTTVPTTSYTYGFLRDTLELTIPAGSTAKVFVFSDLSTLIPTTVLNLS